uniref:Uncharacterized protein n=1 Tax=Rhizophora mucronata TaxID=61149 RepID=A0A2P2NW09_RHIMU
MVSYFVYSRVAFLINQLFKKKRSTLCFTGKKESNVLCVYM